MSKFLVSALQVLVGVVLIATGVGAPAGIAMITSGLFSAAAIALMPDRTRATDYKESPTYGFTQFENPVKGDTPIPVIYSAEGHKTAPVWLQAFVTPDGYDAEDARKASRTQQLSGLLAIAEGPVDDITEVRFNDELVFERVEDYEFGKGTGSRKEWTLPHTRVDPLSVEIVEGTTNRGYATGPLSVLAAVADGTSRTYAVRLPETFVDEIAVEFFNINPQGRSEAQIAPHKMTLQSWLGAEGMIFFHRDTPLPYGTTVYMRYGGRVATGVTITKKNGKIVVKFATAPANGTKLYASFTRNVIGKVDVKVRRGSAHQMPLWGFHHIRNTFRAGGGMAQGSGVTYSTKDEVDDVIVNVESGAGGFVVTDDDGGTNRASAQFTIEVRRQTATALGTNTFDSWYKIPDPRGPDTLANKNGTEFQVEGRTYNQQFWSFSVRSLLQKNAAGANAKSSAGRALTTASEDFVRAKYEVRVTRTNPVASTNNSRYSDDLVFGSATEVRDEALNLPGTALIGFHALATERLNGGAPNVTVVCKGKRNVAKAVVDTTLAAGYRWLTPEAATQSNRVWAAVDLITNWRFGAGEHYDRDANVNVASAIECAEWLDQQVRTSDGGYAAIVSNCYVATTHTFARSSGTWAADGISVGNTIVTTGFANSANNGTFVVTAVGVSTLTVAETLVVESSGSTKRIAQGSVEARSRLDIVLDTRKSLMEHLRDILLPGRVWAVLRGDTWYFVKDDAVDLSACPVVYDDTPLGRTAQNSLGFNHDSIASVPSEVQLTYLKAEEEWQQKEVWVVPTEPGDEPRRIRRVSAYGMTRDTEVNRYGVFIFNQLRNQGASASVGVGPRAIDFGAGDVVRIVSNRVGIDGYWRIFEMSFDTDTYYVRIVAKQYVPANYGGTEDKHRVIRDGFSRLLAQPTPTLSAPAAGVSAAEARATTTPAVAIERIA